MPGGLVSGSHVEFREEVWGRFCRKSRGGRINRAVCCMLALDVARVARTLPDPESVKGWEQRSNGNSKKQPDKRNGYGMTGWAGRTGWTG